MQLQAIIHRPLSEDAYISGTKSITLRLHAAKGDLQKCVVFYGDRVCEVEPIIVECIEMEKVGSDEYHDYFEVQIETEYTRVCYYFLLTDYENVQQFYSEYGFSDEMKCHRTQYFQLPYLHRDNRITMPEWTKEMVMYHIYPDSFASGRRNIGGEKKEITLDHGLVSRSVNGGTLQGIRENLDYIEKLGANCIYLNPIFAAASWHKYDTIDYKKVDPCLGTIQDLRELVLDCHARGIRVILDGVFNHCGSGFFAFQHVLRHGEGSIYRDWFYELQFPIQYVTPPNYEAFAYVKEMPKLNTGNSAVRDYFCEVGRYWIREADIDGWRLDVANEVDHEFWRSFRHAVKQEKRDAFLIGEIWEDANVWLQGDQFDSTMNYTFRNICLKFFAEQSIGVEQFDERVHHMNLRYPWEVSCVQMNFLDTHDVPRFLSYCDGDMEKLKLALFFMMVAVGIPSVFYGDEQLIEGMSEAEYRKPMVWNRDSEQSLYGYYQKWMNIRREHPALHRGNYRTILADDKNEVYVFSRQYDAERCVIVLNRSEEGRCVCVEPLRDIRWRELGEDQKGVGEKIVCPARTGQVYCVTV